MCDFVFRFCLTVGLSVCWVSKLCLSVCLSEQVMFGMGFVCLSVSTSYVWHGVCLFVSTSYVWHGVCLFVCLNKLCLAWGLSVCPSRQVMFGMGFVCLST